VTSDTVARSGAANLSRPHLDLQLEPHTLNPYTDSPFAVAGGACAVCGQRRGTVRVVASDGAQSRGAVVCETCARELMAANGGQQA
jgi:hypothetical protein